MNASWVPGAAWAMVAGDGAVHLEEAPPAESLPRLRAALAAGDIAGAVGTVGNLSGAQARGAVAVLGPRGGQFALWGASTAVAGVGGSAVLVRGSGEPSWVFRTVAGADGVVLGDPRVDLARRQHVLVPEVGAASVQLGSAAPEEPSVPEPVTQSPDESDNADSMFSQMWGNTISRPVEAAALREVLTQDAPGAPIAAPTMTAGLSTPGIPAPRPVPARTAAPVEVSGGVGAWGAVAPPRYLVHDGQTLQPWKSQQLRAALTQLSVVASTGDRVPLVESVVVGRSPTAEGSDGAVLAVSEMHAQVSRNHVRITREGTSLVVTDLGSANGSTISRLGHAAMPLVPYVPTPLGDDDIVELGDGITIRVERP